MYAAWTERLSRSGLRFTGASWPRRVASGHNEPAQRPFKLGHLDHSKVKLRRKWWLAPETKEIVDDAIFAALAPLATSREVQSAIYFHCDDVIAADLIDALRDTVWTDQFDALQAGEPANG